MSLRPGSAAPHQDSAAPCSEIARPPVLPRPGQARRAVIVCCGHSEAAPRKGLKGFTIAHQRRGATPARLRAPSGSARARRLSRSIADLGSGSRRPPRWTSDGRAMSTLPTVLRLPVAPRRRRIDAHVRRRAKELRALELGCTARAAIRKGATGPQPGFRPGLPRRFPSALQQDQGDSGTHHGARAGARRFPALGRQRL